MLLRFHGYWLIGLAFFVAFAFVGCALPPDPDPTATLAQPALSHRRHLAAIEGLQATPADDAEANEWLARVMTRPGYSLATREAALNALAQRDVELAKRTIRRHLPQCEDWGWLTRMSEIVAERGWSDLSPALVSSWSRPTLYVNHDTKRPEYLALVKLHGSENVIEVVYDLFMESRSVGQQGLRTRCWNLLHRLGQRPRLIALLASSEVAPDDAMLIDLQAAARDLGLVPYTREEILWVRKLREPERAEFWSRATAAVQALPLERKAELELRDVPVVVSAWLHDPQLFQMSTDELYAHLLGQLDGMPTHVQDSNHDGFADGSRQRLREYRGRLTWGDLAAMQIALRALRVPQVVDHLFDYADRDLADETTEYGGVIALDGKDRFEVKEFPPAMRHHDQKYISSQAMLDAAYTSIFHFHMHAQRYRNGNYAGPNLGDLNYADNLRANNLVFTFINRNTLNVDYYRHDRIVVDLGVIERR